MMAQNPGIQFNWDFIAQYVNTWSNHFRQIHNLFIYISTAVADPLVNVHIVIRIMCFGVVKREVNLNILQLQ
jgi:hypothetical protein